MRKTEIIKKNFEFRYFFKKGKFFSGDFLEVFIFDSKYKKNKLGIVVSKKIGGSVTRNHLKRYIREAYFSIEDNIKSSINILIIWKKNVAPDKATFFDTKKDLFNILEKAEKIRKI